MVGGVFVVLGIVKNLVPIDGPLACNPHVQLLIKDAFLRKLVLHVFLGGQLVCS